MSDANTPLWPGDKQRLIVSSYIQWDVLMATRRAKKKRKAGNPHNQDPM